MLNRLFDYVHSNSDFIAGVVIFPGGMAVLTYIVITALTRIGMTTSQTVDPLVQISNSLERVEKRLNKLEQQEGGQAKK